MLTVAAVRSSAAASQYFEKQDNYYTTDSSPSQWLGDGAGRLGLMGAVDAEQFKSLLDGYLPDGTRLGTIRDGEWQHRPAWDLTLSAPKSLSVQALVGGDVRLIEAHDKAVRMAMDHIEKTYAGTRIREHGELRTEHTGSLAIAQFRHDLSREKDPQLHTHNLVMNMTKSADGRWRSLDAAPLYRLHKEVGLLYRQTLEAEVRKLGYETEHAKAGKEWSFEIGGVSKDALEHFSGRSAQVEAALDARGLTRETATASEKQVAALDSRQVKDKGVDREALRDQWRTDAQRLNLDVDRLRSEAEGRAASSDYQRQLAETSKIEASQAVNWAIAHLSERDTQFRRDELAQVAFGRGELKTSIADIQATIDRRLEDGELLARPDGKITTREGIDIEKGMMSMERAGRGMTKSLATVSVSDRAQGIMTAQDKARAIVERAEAESVRLGHRWTEDQRQATVGLLTDRNRVVAVQGAAGSAKTSTVIRTVAGEIERDGGKVVGMAPTNSASNQLRDGGGIADSKSLAKHMSILKTEQREIAKLRSAGKATEAFQRETAMRSQVWVVDEASMVSAKQMHDLLKSADRYEARVILVGDTQQLASVGAGRAFAQLQEGHMKTYRLDEIVRQRHEPLREAVVASYRGDSAKALDKIQTLNGIREIKNPVREDGKGVDREAGLQERATVIAQEYSSFSAADRLKSIIVAPGHDDRQAINSAVRDALRERGELGQVELKTHIYQSLSLTEAEKRHAGSYRPGTVVRFNAMPGKMLREHGVEKGTYVTVADRHGDTLQLNIDGKNVPWNPSVRGSGAGKTEAFNPVERGFSQGDLLQLTRGDAERGITSRSVGIVEVVNGNKLTVSVAGKSLEMDMTKPENRHIEHGYAVTAHAAQGSTAERAFVHAESHRSNLTNMRSLYVSLSRAQQEVRVYTDSFAGLKHAVTERTGEKLAAMDERQKHESVRSTEARSGDVRTSEQSCDHEREKGEDRGWSR